MTATPRPSFKPLTDLDDAEIDRLTSGATAFAEGENIPKTTFPRAVKAAGQGASSPAPTTGTEKIAAEAKPFERFTVEIPTYLYEDIRKRISTKKQTKKSVVLNAFHAAGFYVAAEDLIEDGRRGK